MAKQPDSVMPQGPGHRAVHFVGPNGTLRYYVPGSPGLVAHYRFAPDGSQAFRRILSPDGTAVLRTEMVYLGTRPQCTCRVADHTALAASKLQALQQHRERQLPPEALWDLERELHSRLVLQAEDGEYDGGFGEWPDEHGDPQRVVWDEDPSEGLLLDSPDDPRPCVLEDAPVQIRARFLAGIAAGTADGSVDVLAPVVERALFRTVTHAPRIAGGWEDLFQEGMATAVRETAQLSPYPGEQLDEFAARLDRRVATAVRHRLIDLIRRQDAAARNTPSGSLEAGEDAGMNVPAHDGDAFDLLFQPHERARRDAPARHRARGLPGLKGPGAPHHPARVRDRILRDTHRRHAGVPGSPGLSGGHAGPRHLLGHLPGPGHARGAAARLRPAAAHRHPPRQNRCRRA